MYIARPPGVHVYDGVRDCLAPLMNSLAPITSLATNSLELCIWVSACICLLPRLDDYMGEEF